LPIRSPSQWPSHSPRHLWSFTPARRLIISNASFALGE
jgi:hypothetical protein